MVFESLVVDLMNKYLGQYIENLDASQLKIGIWGGDVVLENLHIKGDALKDLDLPVQVKSGFIGKLTLKIPWKNLYKDAVEATLDGLYLLAVPNSSVAYDHKKEAEKAEKDKQAQLAAIEEQLIKKAESKKQGEKKDGFVEKLATQVIKNLQIDIKNIHVRYEDDTTIKSNPFAIGLTLSRLSFQTTNEDWVPSLLNEAAKIIYKVVNLESLSAYWNSKPQKFLSKCGREEQLRYFKECIANTDHIPTHLTYIIKPISLEAKLRLNPHPLSDLEKPKIILGLVLKEIGLNLSHKQYHSIMQLIASMDRMALNEPFRKFKPVAGVTGNTKNWWSYAYKSILQAEVTRRVNLWSWSHIKAHRDKLRMYKKLYKEKLVQKNPGSDLVEKLTKLENDIDVFNITLTRQTAEAELVKSGDVIKSKKSRHQKEENKGWFGGWFGGAGKKKETNAEEANIDTIMGEEEKKLLYEAIDYSEGETAVDPNLPKTYIENQVDVNLIKISVHLEDDRTSESHSLIHLEANNIVTGFAQRPSAKAIALSTTLQDFSINGLKQEDIVPHLISSMLSTEEKDLNEDSNLLRFMFETNPMNETCDQSIILRSRPLQITYDAVTINTLVEFIKPPQDLQFQQLKTVASLAYEDMKEQTATGLQHAMKSRKVTSIDINLMSSYVVIPEEGLYQYGCKAIIIDLGKVSLQSINSENTSVMKDGVLDLLTMRSEAYDKFKIDIKNIQILLANQNEDWILGRTLSTSSMHVLEPLNISILLEKCLVTNDAALPKLKVSGELPLLSLCVTDAKLKTMISLGNSIPLPPSEPTPEIEEFAYLELVPVVKNSDINMVVNNFEDQYGSSPSISSGAHSTTDEEFFTADSDFSDAEDHVLPKLQKKSARKEALVDTHAQLTDLALSFVLDKISITIGESFPDSDKDILNVSIKNFGVTACVKTWETNVNVFLGSLHLQYLLENSYDGSPLYIVKTSMTEMEKNLLLIDVIIAKTNCPDFVTIYENTQQCIKIDFTGLDVNVNSKALLYVKDFAQKFIPDKIIEDSTSVTSVKSEMSKATDGSFVTAEGSNSDSSLPPKEYVMLKKKREIINVKLEAKFESFVINLTDENSLISSIAVKGIATDVTVMPQKTEINAKLQNLIITDPFADTYYHEIITATGGNVLNANVIVYNDNTTGENYRDMNLVDTKVSVKLGAMRIVFIKRYIDTLVQFGSHFQDAKTVAAQAGAMAQEAAVNRAKELAERNPRISLDVNLTVPNIIIPKNSRSMEILSANLGNVKVSNRFEIVGAEDTDIPAVSDNMFVDITDIKLALCQLNDLKDIISEHQLLEPMSLKLNMKRNLAANWFHDVPNINVSGKMDAINIKISSPDISTILKTLNENMAESSTGSDQIVDETINAVSTSGLEATSKDDSPGISSASSATSTLKDVSLTAKKGEDSVWDTLQVNFEMESIKVNLYTDKQRESPLAKFHLQGLNFEMNQRSDTSLNMDASLADILLEDLRLTHKGRLTKYIENKSGVSSTKILGANIWKNSEGSMNIKANVSSLRIILCVEFLVKLADAFTSALSAEDVDKKDTNEKTEEKSKEIQPETSDHEAEIEPDIKSIHIEFILHKPDIILVTDLKSSEAESLILGMKLELILNTSTENSEKRLSCKLSDLQLNSCPFQDIDSLALDDTVEHKKVLSPCNIDVNGTMSENKQDFFIELSKIKISASPIVINTLTEAMALLSSEGSTKSVVGQQKVMKALSGLDSVFSLKDRNFWFIEKPTEVFNAEQKVSGLFGRVSTLDHQENDSKNSEALQLSVPDIRIQLEAGDGHHSVPLLIIQLSANGNVSNWSGGEMKAVMTISLGVVYFNELLSVWEPLIEPVEVNPGSINAKYKLWEVTAEVQQNKEVEDKSIEDLPSLLEMSITSKNILHSTITKPALKAINGLAKAFADAAIQKTQKSPISSRKLNDIETDNVSAGIKIKNFLGRELNVTLGKTLTVVKDATRIGEHEYSLKTSETLYADFMKSEFSDIWALLVNQSKASNLSDNLINVRLPGQQDYGKFDISKMGITYHALSDGKRNVSIVCNVDSKGGVRTVTLQSCVLMYNNLLTDLQLLDETNSFSATIKSDCCFPIPNAFVEDGAKLYLRPIGENINVRKTQVHIEKGELNESLRFSAESKNALPFYINVEATSEEITSAQGVDHGFGTLRKVVCKPSVVLKNLLPFPVQYTAFGVGQAKQFRTMLPGIGQQVFDAEVGKSKIQVKLVNYRGSDWVGTVAVSSGQAELSEWKFENSKVNESFMLLGKNVVYSGGYMKITLYSPYWMINETGQTLEYRGSDDNIIVHPAEKQDFILFSYHSKSFLSKNSLQLRVNKSDTSDKFSIDAVGSNGTIICKNKDFNYMVGINISLTSFALTKIITFKNYFTVTNISSLDLELCEENSSNFTSLLSNISSKFWPETKAECLNIRIKDMPGTISRKFGFRKLDSGVLLKLGKDNFIFVDVTVTESSVHISFKDYFEGATAVMIINHTSETNILYTQSKTNVGYLCLKPSQGQHYLWPQSDSKRLLTWKIEGGKEKTLDVFQETAGNVETSSKIKIFYSLFIDGMQRVLIFTEDKAVADVVQQGLNTERSNIEVNISLQGFSLSISDTKLQREIAYCAITSSGIIWEEKPKKRWTALPLKYAAQLEEAYQKNMSGPKRSSSQSTSIVRQEKYEFDLAKMQMVKPNKAEIRRYFSPGIWGQVTMSNHQTMVHLKMNKIQLDNQLPAAVFPVVLCPIPLPKTIAIDSSPKPFIELSLMTRKSEHQSFAHIKYFKVLVQEFSIKLDMGFISSLLPVFGADEVHLSAEKELSYFTNDITYAKKAKDDDDKDTVDLSQDSGITFYDVLHLSPIKLHVSFSMQNNCYDVDQTSSVIELPFNALTVVLKSVGVTLSDIDDVVFRLGYFERNYQFFSSHQFTNSVGMHYAGQAIKQMYVLVLGLDVIGNPYGLVMGIAEGVTDMFYEPYQGMIQGPGEFVEGLALGAKSLLGHTVGGAAGAVSRVTGALGKGVATITMDDEYKKKRQMEKNKQPADLKEGLARGGKGLVMGFVGGVTGVVTKPMEGAKNEGAAGFFKGVGKGLVGIVARPVSGVIDLASNTFEGIQSLADMSVEVKRMRPARDFDSKTGILHPYSLRKAQGNAMLQEVEKGAFAEIAHYVVHVPLDKNKKSFLIVTDVMILEAHTGEIFGQWNSAWKYDYTEIIEEPHMTAEGIKIVTPKQKHKLFGKSSNGMTITFHDSANAKLVIDLIRHDWNATPKLQRSDSMKKEKRGLGGLSFKKHKH